MERIKNIREEKDLKQKDMANIIGIKRSTYASYETCRDTIPLKHLNTLCNYFNISLDYALGLTDIKRYDNELNEINIKIAGERLKNLRKENNLTQMEISKILNTSRSAWTGYECKKFLISTLLIYEVAKKYNYSIDYLLGKTDFPIKLK